jgi:Raf kinase inhibitor-like YbhB/YbcL family protein
MLQLESPALAEQGQIPPKYTRDGADVSPPLSWSGEPAATKSFALVIADPDAPTRTWVHWVVYNLPPDVHALDEGASGGGMPAGAREGMNDWNRMGYRGPAPPAGRHRYEHRLYALDAMLPPLEQPDAAGLQKAMTGHVLAESVLTGTYEKKRG